MIDIIIQNPANAIIAATILLAIAGISIMIRKSRTMTFEHNDIYVIDGDTFSIKARATKTGETVRVRPVGFDAPEMGQRGGEEAKKALRANLRWGATLLVTGEDQYGRVLARVTTPKGSLAKLMLASGHAHSDDRSPIMRFIKTLPARLSGKGMWKGTVLGFGVVRPVNHRRFNQK